jgi:CubicO group peptidase (beta-lactamase class C family)
MNDYTLTIFLFATLLALSSCKKEDLVLQNKATALAEIFDRAAQNDNLRSLIVYKDGKIIKEKYLIGDSLTAHDVRSVTKSVTSTLVGIAIDKGTIASENDEIGAYLSETVSSIDSLKAAIRVSDILSMTSGISGNEIRNPAEYNHWKHAPNQILYTLNKQMVASPGQRFIYNSGASHLLSGVLTEATNQSVLSFAEKHLFQPLGITVQYWQKDQQGIYNGGAGLQLSPYDMLKFGKLYLNKGIYNDVRVVSEDWVNKATSFKISTNNIAPFSPNYAYLWWMGNKSGHDYFFANGYGGQFILVSPDLNLIVIATNNWAGVSITKANQQWYDTLELIINSVIPLHA